MKYPRPAWILSAGLLGLAPHWSAGAEVDFYRDIYPFLKTN